MQSVYRHMFYVIYSWARSVKTNPIPEISTIAGLAFLTLLNIYTVLGIFHLVTRLDVEWAFPSPFLGCVLGFLIAFYLYFECVNGGKLSLIDSEFVAESKHHKRVWALITTLYIVGSFLFFFGMLLISMMRNRGVW
jgi:hypothetical protein